MYQMEAATCITSPAKTEYLRVRTKAVFVPSWDSLFSVKKIRNKKEYKHEFTSDKGRQSLKCNLLSL